MSNENDTFPIYYNPIRSDPMQSNSKLLNNFQYDYKQINGYTLLQQARFQISMDHVHQSNKPQATTTAAFYPWQSACQSDKQTRTDGHTRNSAIYQKKTQTLKNINELLIIAWSYSKRVIRQFACEPHSELQKLPT